jgi:5-deoxy-glucuronate isomerase
MTSLPNVVHSQALPEGASGQLLHFSRESVQWEWMSMSVHRLQAGETLSAKTKGEEAAFVLLGGRCIADWGAGARIIGKRKNVFDGLPYCVYLPTGNSVEFAAETAVEIAACRAPSTAQLEPKLITPEDVVSSLRGGGNASRQIVDIIRPEFPADKLVVIEVYTPGGNWSSYPPHKHDTATPGRETALEETYYHRINPSQGFAFQRVYTDDRDLDETMCVHDGDVVMVPRGYHPVGAAHGYDLYYLNVMAGQHRSWVIHNDPEHEWMLRKPEPDR